VRFKRQNVRHEKYGREVRKYPLAENIVRRKDKNTIKKKLRFQLVGKKCDRKDKYSSMIGSREMQLKKEENKCTIRGKYVRQK